MTQTRGKDGPVQIGQLPLLKSLAKQYKPPTRAQHQFVETAAAIRENPDDAERAFMARQLILCTLPHSDPGDLPAWSRESGNSALIVQPGYDLEAGKPRSIGYPYGTIPRLLLFWITTEVQRTKNRSDLTILEKRTLKLGRSLAHFMREVGLNPDTGRGKRGDAKRLHNQMDRLFSSRITFQQKIETPDAHGKRKLDMPVTSQTELWWDPKRPEQGALWQSWVRLGEDFYNALVALPVPVDMRALRALKRSSLALDLYAWVCYRAFVIVQKNQPPQFTAWTLLARQLGADYTDPKNFKKKTKAALRKIAALYPGLTIGQAQGGLTIHATRLAVPLRHTGKVL
ncbi:MAG: plasmid encoded RepA protein [Acidobacteriaceae bacterium]|nr:plasmid encoded RepA protein [Acidobacteriaceae bacterium]